MVPKPGIHGIIIAITLSFFPLFIKYSYLEISLSLLLIVLLIIVLKTGNGIISDAFCILLIGFFLHSALFCSLVMEENGLFNLGIVLISLPWIFVFNRYFRLEGEERLPLLEVLFERRESFEIFGTLISMGFLKLIFDLQIMEVNIRIGKEALSNFYSINFQLFGIILTGVIMIAVFIARGHEDREQRKKEVLAQGVKGILLFAIPIIFLSVLGVISNMDLYIGRDMSSIDNTLVTLLFSLTVLMSIFCISFIGMLIYDLLEIEENNSKSQQKEA